MSSLAAAGFTKRKSRHARAGIVTGYLVALVWGGTIAAGAEPAGLSERQQRLFAGSCAACHVTPGLGAPVLGVDADWAPRRERGFEALVATTVEGSRHMPALGTCGACDEADFRALVAFLAGLPAQPETAP